MSYTKSGFGHYVGEPAAAPVAHPWLDTSELPRWQTGSGLPRLASLREEIDLIEAGRPGREINAASLSRVFQTYWKRGQQGFAIMSPWVNDGSRSEEENRKKLQEFKFEAMPWGYSPLTGRWPNDAGVTEIDPSFFISNIPFEDARQLADDFDQNSFMYAGPDLDELKPEDRQGRVWMVETKSGKTIEKGDLRVMSPGDVASAYSRMRPRSNWNPEKRIEEENSPPEWRGEVPPAKQRAFVFPDAEQDPNDQGVGQIKEGFYFSSSPSSSGEHTFLSLAWKRRSRR